MASVIRLSLTKEMKWQRKGYDGTLAEVDFDFAKAGHNEKSAKGTVRRKIQVLQYNNSRFM